MERTKTKNSEITQAERAGMYINILKYYLTFNHIKFNQFHSLINITYLIAAATRPPPLH